MKLLLYYRPEDVLFLPLPLKPHNLTLHIASAKGYFISKYPHYDNSPQQTASGALCLVPAPAWSHLNLCLHLCLTDLDIFKWQFL